ncbi:hypothetical protein HIM_00634 [Hirsutella minnesotensis 3608]|nr:hypothetical protein HIM_00634 [Hirsutella minnesotensis 3608]
MFAVPGWSVSADSLKAESASPADGSAGGKSKKRKRAGASASENVTASNVADLYETVVEGKEKKPAAKTKREPAAKKHKKAEAGPKESKAETKQSEKQTREKCKSQPEPNKEATSTADKKDKREKTKKQKGEKRRQSSPPAVQNVTEASPTKVDADADSTAAKPSAKPRQQAPQPAKLTPLQASMREKLVSARFRHLNETLYTRPSAEAFHLFEESPDMFDEYHEGFRRQVKVWPENPVDSFLADIRARARARPPGKGRAGGGKGELWVAEIKSRFVGPARRGAGGNAPVDHSVGNRRRQPGAGPPLSKKAKAAREAEAEAVNGEDLAVDVDGQEDHRRQTDVSAFVEALRKRGFVLHGERDEAIDLSNRMFVKMHFIKGAAPTEGKAAKPQEARKTAKGTTALKWTDEAGKEKASEDALILKPCVYKIR